jgi:hypothetical protein
LLKTILGESFRAYWLSVAVDALKRGVEGSIGSNFNEKVAILDLGSILFRAGSADDPAG